jgi:hypothetical protein
VGADSFVAFYGVRVPFDPDDEEGGSASLDDWGGGLHPDSEAALQRGLEVYTGRDTEGGEHFAYVGRSLGELGYEGAMHVRLDPAALADTVESVARSLAELGYRDEPALHLQFVGQY